MLSSNPCRRWSEDSSICWCQRVRDCFFDAGGRGRTAVPLLRGRWFRAKLGGKLSKRKWDDLERKPRLSWRKDENVHIFRGGLRNSPRADYSPDFPPLPVRERR